MYKKILLYLLSILLLTSCTSTNEDPTNIELEVLRVSLLEKELMIDELHQSLDKNNRLNNTLIQTVEDLEKTLEHEKELKLRLLEGQTQILTIQENKPHFYDVVNDVLYILTVYDNEELEYKYEDLLRYTKDEPSVIIYKGSDIQYKIDAKTNSISVLDNEKFQIMDKELKVRYIYDIDLNDPLIELIPTLYIGNTDKQKSYVLLWKYIEEETPTLYSVISFDYHNLDDIISTQHNVNTQYYEIADDQGALVYVEATQEGNTLVSLNLETGDKVVIHKNKSEPFSMYKEDSDIYYFDQENNKFLRYDND